MSTNNFLFSFTHTMKKINLIVPTLLSALFLVGASFAQEDKTSTESAELPAAGRLSTELQEMESPAMKGITLEKPVVGRLPNGYRNVVTNSQRDEIYKVQKEYNEIIERLKVRIQLLEVERDQKVDAFLTPEQADKIKKTLGSLESEKHEMKGENRPAPRRARRAVRQTTETP